MRRFLLDSNAVTALISRKEPFASRLRVARDRGGQIGTCEPVLAELYYGLELSATREENLIRLERTLKRIRVWPLNRAATREYGRIAADLKRRGRQIQVVDMMVAAIANTLPDCTVVTTDSDFSAIPELSVVDWTAGPTEGSACDVTS